MDPGEIIPIQILAPAWHKKWESTVQTVDYQAKAIKSVQVTFENLIQKIILKKQQDACDETDCKQLGSLQDSVEAKLQILTGTYNQWCKDSIELTPQIPKAEKNETPEDHEQRCQYTAKSWDSKIQTLKPFIQGSNKWINIQKQHFNSIGQAGNWCVKFEAVSPVKQKAQPEMPELDEKAMGKGKGKGKVKGKGKQGQAAAAGGS